jgi:hypothetical protein
MDRIILYTPALAQIQLSPRPAIVPFSLLLACLFSAIHFRRPDSFAKLERSKVFHVDLSKKNDEPEDIRLISLNPLFLSFFSFRLLSLDFSAIIFKSQAKMIFDLFLSTNTRQRMKKSENLAIAV